MIDPGMSEWPMERFHGQISEWPMSDLQGKVSLPVETSDVDICLYDPWKDYVWS